MNRRAVDAVSDEIAQEKAQSFGRAAKLLEDALAALRAFDADARDDPRARAMLVAHAAERVLHFIVQREACGLRDPDYVFRSFAVPAEVISRIGTVRRAALSPR